MKEVVLDTETTGISVKEGHRIVEIGCIELDNLIPTNNKFHCYLNPERKVSEKALEVHGYSDEFLIKQQKFSEIEDEFLNFIKDKNKRIAKIDELINKFQLNNLLNIKAKYLSGGQKRKLVISLALLGEPKILICDEIFAALDVLSIQMLKMILINLQKDNNDLSIIICEHQARELLAIVDRAMILSKGKIIAKGTPNELMNNELARSDYFGDQFKLN